jgi:O-antigen/teichoic acid export membrane protein
MSKNKYLIQTSFILIIISNFNNVFNFLCQLILGRALSPEDFGIFNSVLSFFLVLLSFSSVITFLVTREIIHLIDNTEGINSFAKDITYNAVKSGLVVTLAFVLFSSIIAQYLEIDSIKPVLICSIFIMFVLAQAVFNGILQGLSRYTIMNIGFTVQTGTRLLFTGAVVVFSLSYNGALIAILLSYVAVTIYYLYHLSDQVIIPKDRQKHNVSLQKLFKGAVPIGLIIAYGSILSNIDIAIVKHFFSAYETGIYSAGAIVGRIIFYLPGMLMYILFAEVVRSNAIGESAIAKTVIIGSITLLISGAGALCFYFFPTFFIRIVMGAKYLSASPILVIIGFSMIPLTALLVLFNFCVAKGLSFLLLPSYLILFLSIFCIYIFAHDTPLHVAYTLLICLLITLIVDVSLFYVKFKTEINRIFGNLRNTVVRT